MFGRGLGRRGLTAPSSTALRRGRGLAGGTGARVALTILGSRQRRLLGGRSLCGGGRRGSHLTTTASSARGVRGLKQQGRSGKIRRPPGRTSLVAPLGAGLRVLRPIISFSILSLGRLDFFSHLSVFSGFSGFSVFSGFSGFQIRRLRRISRLGDSVGISAPGVSLLSLLNPLSARLAVRITTRVPRVLRQDRLLGGRNLCGGGRSGSHLTTTTGRSRAGGRLLSLLSLLSLLRLGSLLYLLRLLGGSRICGRWGRLGIASGKG